MNRKLPNHYHLHPAVVTALRFGQPIVALESTVITHGLPRPDNLKLARQLEDEVHAWGAVAATIAIFSGKIHIGLTAEELELLALEPSARKISRRDFSIAIAKKMNGGTTVSGTLLAAHAAGLQVFATGGIGGVHRGNAFDVSADLNELSHTPMLVVCSGAKAILDLPATREVLETYGIPVIGYQTDEFPAFYSTTSGLPVDQRVDDVKEIAEIARAHWSLGLESALLVTNPPPENSAIPAQQIEEIIELALGEAKSAGVSGGAVTPFLLSRVSQLSAGASQKVNLDLLVNNARLAAQIAKELSVKGQNMII